MDDPPDFPAVRIVEATPGRSSDARLLKSIDHTGRADASVWIRPLISGHIHVHFGHCPAGRTPATEALFATACTYAQAHTDNGLVHVGHACPEFTFDRAHARRAGFIELDHVTKARLRFGGYREWPPEGTLVLFPMEPMPVCLRALELYERGQVQVGVFKLPFMRELMRIYGEKGVPIDPPPTDLKTH